MQIFAWKRAQGQFRFVEQHTEQPKNSMKLREIKFASRSCKFEFTFEFQITLKWVVLSWACED
jgi:hypothetical protein